MMNFKHSNIDIVGKAKLWYSISITVILIGVIGMVINMVSNEDNFPLVRGIDFAGGSIIQMTIDDFQGDPVSFASNLKAYVSNFTAKEPQIQFLPAEGEGLAVTIRADATLIESTEALSDIYAWVRENGGDFGEPDEEEVSAVISKELTQNAIIGVMVGLILILIYITIRLSLDFAVFAVVALFHDILILVGMFALFQIEINSWFVAVLLTVVGYSINDTIIIYDRIRENMKLKRHLPFDKMVNQSLLETMARSINTSFTTLLAILALLIFGGISIKNFMLGLGIGITTGTYSSIFVASILLVSWRLRKKGLAITDEDIGVDTAELIRKDEEQLMTFDEDVESESKAVSTSKSSAKSKRRRRRY